MAYETKSEGPRPLGFLLSEAEFGRSRDEITVASGQGMLEAGHVLGKVTASGKYVSADPEAVDGSETAAAVLAYPVDATDADAKVTAITRAAQLKKDELIYDAGVDDGTKTATKVSELAAAGLIVR